MEGRKVRYAGEGMILTDGEIYGRKIFFAEGETGESFYEISFEEYEKLTEEEE